MKILAMRKNSTEILKRIFFDLDAAYSNLEEATKTYFSHFDLDDEEFESSNKSLDESYKLRCSMFIKISEKPKTDNGSFLLPMQAPTEHEY